MKHFVLSIFDEKAAAFLPPFVLHREEMALRVFKDMLVSSDHQFGKHPEDYTMFVIGVFDDGKGTIEPCPPRSLGNGLELLSSTPFDLEEVS